MKNPDLDLSLEQRVAISNMAIQIKLLPRHELEELLLSSLAQGLIKDNAIRELVSRNIRVQISDPLGLFPVELG